LTCASEAGGRHTLLASIAVGKVIALGAPVLRAAQTAGPRHGYVAHDAHLHLTNYVQQGTDLHDFLKIMGTKVGRVALFGLPLQQTWSYGNTGDFAPTYDLQTDAPLHCYLYAPLFAKLTPDAKEKVLKGNYERLFDEARVKVRAWERANPK